MKILNSDVLIFHAPHHNRLRLPTGLVNNTIMANLRTHSFVTLNFNITFHFHYQRQSQFRHSFQRNYENSAHLLFSSLSHSLSLRWLFVHIWFARILSVRRLEPNCEAIFPHNRVKINGCSAMNDFSVRIIHMVQTEIICLLFGKSSSFISFAPANEWKSR